MKEVEQVFQKNIVIDFDEKLTSKEINNVLTKFGQVEYNKGIRTINNINILIKNVTYLGHPHPLYKKRIQIPKEWKEYLLKPNTVLCGIYTYQSEYLFVVFANYDFANNDLNQSSAHVYINDLLRGGINGFCSKTDTRGNYILVMNEYYLDDYLNSLRVKFSDFDSIQDLYRWQKKYAIRNDEKLITICSDYADSIKRTKWFGVNAYSEMAADNYNNAYQPEWAGFYNEFRFEKYLIFNDHLKYIKLHGDWSSNIDLDCLLNDGRDKFFGDLKTHTLGGDLIGNDIAAWEKALLFGKRIWLIVVDHLTEMDKDHNWEVRDHWNNMKRIAGRGNPNSGYTRMKNNVEILGLYVFEINKSNLKYLSIFNQGKQQDGSSRKAKYLIKKKDFNNFIVFRNI